MVTQVVLAELAGAVAEVEQELRHRRRAGPQVGRTAGELRRDHTGAQRGHAGKEGVPACRAALLGVVAHELGAFIGNAVDVGRFGKPHPLRVRVDLHPADVITHDEKNVGLLILGGR
jgi:hypothetical protein